VAGNLHRQPDADLEGQDLERWIAKAESLFATGAWPREDTVSEQVNRNP
jgi:hypothetical protein